MYIYIYIYTYIHTYIHTYIYIYIYTHIYIYIYIYIYYYMKVAKAIQSELHQYGICVQVDRTARDLGLCLNPSGRRSTAGIQAKR